MDDIIFALSLIVTTRLIPYTIISFSYQNIGEKLPILGFLTWKIALCKVSLESISVWRIQNIR